MRDDTHLGCRGPVGSHSLPLITEHFVIFFSLFSILLVVFVLISNDGGRHVHYGLPPWRRGRSKCRMRAKTLLGLPLFQQRGPVGRRRVEWSPIDRSSKR